MKYIIALTALCVTPYTIHAMDKPEYVAPHAMTVHAKPVQTLYLSTLFLLTNFNPNNKNTRTELVAIIQKMNNLKLAQPPIREREIGFYCYMEKKHISPTNTFCNKIFGSLPMPIAQSIFFARLSEYNDHLEKKSLTSPNNEEIKNYFKNLKRENLVTKNAQHNIIIPQQIINAVTLSIPASTGVKEFATLLANIKGLLENYSSEEMYQTAELIYHEQIYGKQEQP